MSVFDTAKQALRKHISENKEKITSDLEEMSNKQTNNNMGIFDKVASDYKVNDEPMFKVNETPKLFKYYLEVVGGQKELYTVKANGYSIDSSGCYRFVLNDEVVAMYPIARTIVKSIEEKSNEEV